MTTSWTDSPITRVVSTAMMPFMPGRVGLFELGEDRAATFVDVEGIGVGELLDADADGIAACEAVTGEFEAGVVVFSTDFGAADVLEQDDSAAVGAVFDDDVFELPGIGETADDANRHLKFCLGSEGCWPS